jgi:hypothetical protein
MIQLGSAPRTFTVSIDRIVGEQASFEVTYTPVSGRADRSSPTSSRSSNRKGSFVARVSLDRDAHCDWVQAPPVADRATLEPDAVRRSRVFADWFTCVDDLVEQVADWARQDDWSTRIVDKPMNDVEIGQYRVPALLLQKLSVKLFFEPLRRVEPNVDGAFDLCLMPAYDDAARISGRPGQWHLEYEPPEGSGLVATASRTSLKLTAANLHRVLRAIFDHAG